MVDALVCGWKGIEEPDRRPSWKQGAGASTSDSNNDNSDSSTPSQPGMPGGFDPSSMGDMNPEEMMKNMTPEQQQQLEKMMKNMNLPKDDQTTDDQTTDNQTTDNQTTDTVD